MITTRCGTQKSPLMPAVCTSEHTKRRRMPTPLMSRPSEQCTPGARYERHVDCRLNSHCGQVRMTRSTNMEHVEVLRDLSECCRAAIKAGDWKVDGACDPDAVLRRADAAIAALPASQSGDAESKLADAGVFTGHHGLRGLADADLFWEKQPYGTRLYYGDGGMDYLHRGVLQKAVEILDAAPQPPAEAHCTTWSGRSDA